MKNMGKEKREQRLTAVYGLLAGLLNGLLGTGGGMLLLPFLTKTAEKRGQPAAAAHATGVAVIAPVCAVSAAVYLWRGQVTLSDILPYLWWVLPGAAVGAWLLPKVKSSWLHRIFGGFVLYAAMKMLLSAWNLKQ